MKAKKPIEKGSIDPKVEKKIAEFVKMVVDTVNRKQLGSMTYKAKKGSVTVGIAESKIPGNLIVSVTSWSGYDMPIRDLKIMLPRIIEYNCELLEPKKDKENEA